ncbi:MAG: hypothetical protein ABII01_03845 [Candidatus Woesearchaeota archaeon]
MIVFILVPKNSGLRRYREEALSFFTDKSRLIEVRAEDIPFLLKQFKDKGKKAFGLTGEDLYKEFCLEKRCSKLKVLKRISWDDEKALFNKPTLCLIGPKNNRLESMKKDLTVCISSKYKRIARKYLNFLERKGFIFKKIYVNGCVETSCSEGLADLIIDIVYTGDSLNKFKLSIYDKIMQSDFLILSNGFEKECITPNKTYQVQKV